MAPIPAQASVTATAATPLAAPAASKPFTQVSAPNLLPNRSTTARFTV